MAKKPTLKARRWRPEDIPRIIACHAAAYPDFPTESHFGRRLHEMELTAFPEGQFLVEEGGKVIGYATSIIVQLDDADHFYTWTEITGGGTFSTHTPSGDTLYGADIAVHPEHRGRGVAGILYKERKRILKRYNLRRMVAHGRIPGYHSVAGRITPEEYVEKVEQGELKDSALNAHLKAGYSVRKVLADYVTDKSSLNYCTLLEMPNDDFKPQARRVAATPLKRPVRKMRVCAAQYQMRRIATWDDFERTVDFFVDSADSYHSHFLVLPELFTAQLFSTMDKDIDDHSAIRALAKLTDKYLEMFRDHATSRRLFIVGGSHPVLRDDGKLYNVAHLFTPSGQVYTQDKLHVTPSERHYWDISPGEGISVFETPFGRVGILICYDVEFPELVRLMALAGIEVLFVPFSTDEKKAYFRVRYCAQARSVENYIYTVIAGNVGNLPAVRPYLLNYGQSAIFTPSDFAFPLEAKLGEADGNIETVVMADMDLSSLAQQRDLGSVRPLHDRRVDLYDLRSKVEVRVVRAE